MYPALYRTLSSLASIVLAPIVVTVGGCVAVDENADPPWLGSTEAAQITFNGWPFDAALFNALATNPDALPTLASSSLESAVADPYIREQLRDPFAAVFLRYLASCALDPGQSLQWPSGTGAPITVDGVMGLCPGWQQSAPSQACLELVSACVLARNNNFGTPVPVSLRGRDTSGLTLPTDGPVDPAMVVDTGSSVACTTPTSGPERDCGWRVDGLATCEPGAAVMFTASDCVGDAMLRLCPGSEACRESRALGTTSAACAGSLHVTCPAAGTITALVAPYQSTGYANALVAADRAHYPGAERDFFDVLEGAFFGDIFTAAELSSTVHVRVEDWQLVYRHQGQDVVVFSIAPDMRFGDAVAARHQAHREFLAQYPYHGQVFGSMYACSAPEFAEHEARARARVCAISGDHERCAARWVGSCAERCKPAVDRGGDLFYQPCDVPQVGEFRHPLTSYLY